MTTWRTIRPWLLDNDTAVLEQHERHGVSADTLLFMARDTARYDLWQRAN
jgi:hypothetical protein